MHVGFHAVLYDQMVQQRNFPCVKYQPLNKNTLIINPRSGSYISSIIVSPGHCLNEFTTSAWDIFIFDSITK